MAAGGGIFIQQQQQQERDGGMGTGTGTGHHTNHPNSLPSFPSLPHFFAHPSIHGPGLLAQQQPNLSIPIGRENFGWPTKRVPRKVNLEEKAKDLVGPAK